MADTLAIISALLNIGAVGYILKQAINGWNTRRLEEQKTNAVIKVEREKTADALKVEQAKNAAGEELRAHDVLLEIQKDDHTQLIETRAALIEALQRIATLEAQVAKLSEINKIQATQLESLTRFVKGGG